MTDRRQQNMEALRAKIEADEATNLAAFRKHSGVTHSARETFKTYEAAASNAKKAANSAQYKVEQLRAGVIGAQLLDLVLCRVRGLLGVAGCGLVGLEGLTCRVGDAGVLAESGKVGRLIGLDLGAKRLHVLLTAIGHGRSFLSLIACSSSRSRTKRI